MALRRTVAYRQPQYLALLDTGNPLARGLVYAFNGDALARELTVGTKVIPQPSGRMRGFGATFGSGTTDSVQTALTTHATQRTYVVVVRKNGAGGGSAGRIFDKRVSGAQVELLFTSATELTFGRNFTTTAGQWSVTNSLTGTRAVAVTYDSSSTANDPRIFVDGVAGTVTETSAPAGTASTNTDAYVIGNRKNDNARNWDGLIGPLLIWDRILSDAEIAAVSANPWQVFAPDRRIWVPADSSGPVVHSATGALGNAGAQTVGSATHVGNHSTTGSLSGAGGAVSGISARTRQHASNGALTNAGAVVVGAAARSAPSTHDASGSLQGSGAIIAGAATHFGSHPSSGSPSGAGAAISGSALRTPAPVVHAASGALGNPGAVLVGVAINETNAPPVVSFSGGFTQEDKRRKRYEEERRKRWDSYQPKQQPKLESKKDEIEEAKRALFKAKLEADQAKKDAELASQELLSGTIIRKARERAAIAARRVRALNSEIAELERQEKRRIDEGDLAYVLMTIAAM